MITVGGFNSSVDRSLVMDELRLGAVNRVREARAWPGGKGLHVALTVAALGEPVRLVGLIDAAHRHEFEDVLGAAGVEFHGMETAGVLRTCLALRDQGGRRLTEVLEPGPELDVAEQRGLRDLFLSLASDSALAVLSGSLPRGFDDGVYGELTEALRGRGVRCLVDASGEVLRRAVAARPFLIKPNRDEVEQLTGHSVETPAAAARAAREIGAGGVWLVAVSMGEDGMVAAQGARALHAFAPVAGVTNTVGSGDCLLGGLAVGLVRELGLEGIARLGVACGTANALSPETGWVRRADIEAVLPQVRLSEA